MTATAALKHAKTEHSPTEETVEPARRSRAHDIAVVATIAVIQLVWITLLGYGLWVVI